MLVMVVMKTIKNVLDSFNQTPLITYTMYLKEQTKQYKENKFNTQNWTYDEIRYVIKGEIQSKARTWNCLNGNKYKKNGSS